jgi:hypothetical protein
MFIIIEVPERGKPDTIITDFMVVVPPLMVQGLYHKGGERGKVEGWKTVVFPSGAGKREGRENGRTEKPPAGWAHSPSLRGGTQNLREAGYAGGLG